MAWARKALIVAGLVAALFAPGIARVGARQAHPPARRLVHVVQAGDTLWTIAQEVAPRADVVATVERLIDANHLKGASLRPGQPLFLPSR
jgi:Tfp pilus assembly protein FimV